MRLLLELAQLVLYVALLALLGQGLLYLLAGPRRDTNIFYRTLQVVSKPFTALMRKLTPQRVADKHVPVATFFVLLVVYAVVTFERIRLCVAAGMVGCR